MRNKFLTFFVSVFVIGCSEGDELSLHPTPLVISVRFEMPGSSPNEIEKYFTKSATKALSAAPHVSMVHPIAMTNAATLTVFFQEGIKFAEGEEIIQSVIKSVSSPKKFSAVNFTELCGDDLSQSDVMHLAKLKGVQSESVLDKVITISSQLAENVLPKEEYDSMFSNECNEAPDAPLYVLEK